MAHLTPVTSQLGASSSFTSRNRFDELSHLSDDDIYKLEEDLPATAGTSRTQQSREHKPPPIYVYGVTNYQDMVSYLTVTLEEEQYYCKALSDEMIKINVSTSDSYRRLIKQLQAAMSFTILINQGESEPTGWSYPSPSFHPPGCHQK